ncbi:hypothetical protein [Streptomyces sp. SID9727]|uniref:hypothetical protein n=1 Tax=Streptomyces sp. SID9727 TaxID=2706114 RepID=UPI0019456171|nr:hypothetical protein [Streptomyces sp. SID9727]
MRRFVMAGMVATALLLAGCSSDSEPSSSPDEVAESLAEEEPAPDPAVEGAEDTSVQDYLDEHGITDAMVMRLAAVAEANNYADPPMAEPDAQLFATVIGDHCETVASGEKTWDYYKEDDKSTGGTQAQVDAFYGFTQDTFCPSMTSKQ